MDLQKNLLQSTLQTSHFETRRDYISLSQIYQDVETLLRQYREGFEDSESIRMKCRLGYWMEQGMMERLLTIDGVTKHPEIIVPGCNNLIKGHPDFLYNECPGDCKSFPLDEYLPQPNNIPHRIYWQMQGYMLYSNTRFSYILSESRQSGIFSVISVRANPRIQENIQNKVDQLKKILV